ncbi:MAG: deoxyribodipyrimidine photo-lyase, partial [Burkholderiales bacterium]|nr:deoxyribodipyrimidine photo-lyase [Burkholderiales bacterium]
VTCVFVFDTEILDGLPSRADRRVEFIHGAVCDLRLALEALGGGLHIAHGRARDEIPRLAAQLRVDAVYANHDYEPAAVARDHAVAERLDADNRRLVTFKDHCIFEKDEVLTQAGRPFTVFTPYRKAWLAKANDFFVKSYPVASYASRLEPASAAPVPALESLGFERTNLAALKLPVGLDGGRRLFDEFLGRMDAYRERRDFPAVRGPSYLSVHLRFGTVSIRELARAAIERDSDGAATWLSELIWRDFYFQILWHHPHVVERSFKPEYEGVPFTNRQDHFDAWCEGRTGYPLVDAAMRQINGSGYMHNRLRMVAASFLVKDLHVDWRWGERYFAQHLNDFDLAANNGGWQWAASTGCDAQPYFRIFNPVTQSERFDPDGKFIRLYVPELANVPTKYVHAPWTLPPLEQKAAGVVIGTDYPGPIVDHAEARKTALDMYGVVKSPK